VTSVDFMRRVREQATPDLSEPSLEFAVRHLRSEGKIGERYLSTCLQIARWLEQYWTFRQAREASGVNASPDADEPLPRAPQLTRDDYLHKLQPLVKSIRQNIFQQDHAPFASKEAAAAWIQDKASQPRRASHEEQARLYQIDQDLRTSHHEWRARTRVEWRDDDRHDFLAYQDGKGEV
jgi:hypothetical protein